MTVVIFPINFFSDYFLIVFTNNRNCSFTMFRSGAYYNKFSSTDSKVVMRASIKNQSQ